jgi:serine phosphatase RsbU (regulator of sigma subunit)
LENKINNREQIIKEIDAANSLIWSRRGTPHQDFDPFELIEDALEKSKVLKYDFGIAQCTLNKGMGAFIIKHNKDSSLKFLNEALNLFKFLDNKKWIANAYVTLGIINNSIGNSEAALYNSIKGIGFYESNEEDIDDSIMAYYVIGTVYKDLKKYDEAESYFLKGAKFNYDNSSWTGRIYTGLSNIYNEQGKYENALELAYKSLNILIKEKNKIAESRALNDIGSIYKTLKKFDQALDYFFQSLKIREEVNVLHFVLGSLLEIATIYLEMEHYSEAIFYFLKAESAALETNHQARLYIIYQKLAELYKITNELDRSINYYEKLILLSNEINSKEKDTKIDNLQNTLLLEKEQEIERLRNVELKNAYTLISEKNKEITDSIRYALRIQNALLASNGLLKKNLNDFFVLYKPKDIVSGDFYWATENETDFYLAVCDSTGHGVPGAFMSLLNISFLNEAIIEKNIIQPNEILNHVRTRLIENLSQDGGQDGMDAILLRINKATNTITYSAANNQPIIIRNDEIMELEKDKMPVGKGELTGSFSLHEIKLNKGDCLYLYTDGFADQFGGPNGKKFKYKKLNELLASLNNKGLNDQKLILESDFNTWKGNLEQVDDVCIIGIRS